MELDMLGDQRTAMFVIISDTDDTFNFIVAVKSREFGNFEEKMKQQKEEWEQKTDNGTENEGE